MKPMKKIDTYIYKLGLWAGAALSLTACVDEDLSDCPPNVEMREITVSYQIDLQHGVDPEFEAELLSLHLGFWNSPQNLYRDLVFQPEDMPEELFFKVTLPVDNYDHLAVANHNNDRVGGGLHTFDNVLEDVVVDETPISPDTIKALAYPPFSGVLSMRMEEDETDHYTVLMSPVVGKVKLHVNHPETMRNIKCYLSRTQQGFLCWEDAYISNDRLEAVFLFRMRRQNHTTYIPRGRPDSGRTCAGSHVQHFGRERRSRGRNGRCGNQHRLEAR